MEVGLNTISLHALENYDEKVQTKCHVRLSIREQSSFLQNIQTASVSIFKLKCIFSQKFPILKRKLCFSRNSYRTYRSPVVKKTDFLQETFPTILNELCR